MKFRKSWRLPLLFNAMKGLIMLRCFTLGLLIFTLCPCPALRAASPDATESGPAAGRSVLLKGVPHVHQKPDFCGEACAASWLRRLGHDVDQDFVFDAAALDPAAARGCYTKELAAALRSIGFDIGRVWNSVAVEAATQQIDQQWQQLHADLKAGYPTIICTRYDARPDTTEHFRLIVGYDAGSDEVLYHEPAEADGGYRRMKRDTMLALWPLKYREDQWLIVRMPLKGKPTIEPPSGDRLTAADFAQHLMQLKERLPSEDFSVVIQPPFVVIGDEPPSMVQRRAEGTVQWAVDRLKRSYFKKDPAEVLDIWLFKDKASYEAHAQQLFGSVPSTPYGYFSSADRALVMNIATGGGTLVHEIVHPFIAANFPACPAWLNEGLGSLYEQSSSRGDRIVGLTNWRLAGLQQAIENGQLPSFQQLCATTSHQFYRQDPGTNYAQARYLCYYLQEHDLLETYYHRFVANHADDPSGYKTLQAVLQRDDMQAFQKDWEQYVMNLEFR